MLQAADGERGQLLAEIAVRRNPGELQDLGRGPVEQQSRAIDSTPRVPETRFVSHAGAEHVEVARGHRLAEGMGPAGRAGGNVAAAVG